MVDRKMTPANPLPEGTIPTGKFPPQQDYFLREPEVKQISGLCKEARRKLEKAGKFPKRVKLGGYAVGWLKSEIDAWLADCIAQRDNTANAQKGGIA